MNTNQLQEMAWDADDCGAEVQVFWHDSQSDVIVRVEINGEVFENEFLDVELEPNDFAEAAWRE